MGQMGGNYNYDSVTDVQWEFGFGLSYTTYSYSNLKVDKTSFTADDVLTVSVDVTNTGNREILLPLQLNLAMRFPFCLKNIEYYFVKIR